MNKLERGILIFLALGSISFTTYYIRDQLPTNNSTPGQSLSALSLFGYSFSSPKETSVSLIKNYYTITNYGVIANDGKPDALAIEKALADMPENATVYFPTGTYDIDQPIVIKNNNLTLTGSPGTWLKFSSTVDYFEKYNQLRVGVLNICASNVTVNQIGVDQNFRASGRKIPAKPLIGGIIIGCYYTGTAIATDNVTIKNSSVYDYFGDGISAWNANVSNFIVDNNTLTSSYIVGGWTSADSSYLLEHGQQGINAVSGTNITITNNRVYGALDDAIAIHVRSTNVTISNNTITTTGGRILVYGITNGIVDSNRITYIEDGATAIIIGFDPDAFTVSLNNGVKVTNNTIDAVPGVTVSQGIRLYGPGSNIEVSGNTVSTVDQQAIGIQMNSKIFLKDGKSYFGENITLKDNNFINFKIGIQQNTGIKGYAINYGVNNTPDCERGLVNLDYTPPGPTSKSSVLLK